MWLCDGSPDGVQRTRESHHNENDSLRNNDGLGNVDRLGNIDNWVATIVFRRGEPYRTKR